MLNYYDDSGYLLKKYLNLPELKSSWFLFELEAVNELIHFMKSDSNMTQYIVLNHISYKKMNKRLMDYQGAFGLCAMNSTFKQKPLSQNHPESNIYNDLSPIKNVPDAELLTYIRHVFNTDFGMMINDYNNELKIESVLASIKNKKPSVYANSIKSLSLFIEFHDLYMGIVTIYLTETRPITKSNISLDDINRLIDMYGCRIAGSMSIKNG